MMDGLIPTGYIRHCPEQVFALTAFATVILLKAGLNPSVECSFRKPKPRFTTAY